MAHDPHDDVPTQETIHVARDSQPGQSGNQSGQPRFVVGDLDALPALADLEPASTSGGSRDSVQALKVPVERVKESIVKDTLNNQLKSEMQRPALAQPVAESDVDAKDVLLILDRQMDRQSNSFASTTRMLLVVIAMFVILIAALSGAGLYFDVFGFRGGAADVKASKIMPDAAPIELQDLQESTTEDAAEDAEDAFWQPQGLPPLTLHGVPDQAVEAADHPDQVTDPPVGPPPPAAADSGLTIVVP